MRFWLTVVLVRLAVVRPAASVMLLCWARQKSQFATRRVLVTLPLARQRTVDESPRMMPACRAVPAEFPPRTTLSFTFTHCEL